MAIKEIVQYRLSTFKKKWCKICCGNKIKQVFFILTKRELSVNKKYLQAPTLAGLPRLSRGSGPPSCTTPREPTVYECSTIPCKNANNFWTDGRQIFKISGENFIDCFLIHFRSNLCRSVLKNSKFISKFQQIWIFLHVFVFMC